MQSSTNTKNTPSPITQEKLNKLLSQIEFRAHRSLGAISDLEHRFSFSHPELAKEIKAIAKEYKVKFPHIENSIAALLSLLIPEATINASSGKPLVKGIELDIWSVGDNNDLAVYHDAHIDNKYIESYSSLAIINDSEYTNPYPKIYSLKEFARAAKSTLEIYQRLYPDYSFDHFLNVEFKTDKPEAIRGSISILKEIGFSSKQLFLTSFKRHSLEICREFSDIQRGLLYSLQGSPRDIDHSSGFRQKPIPWKAESILEALELYDTDTLVLDKNGFTEENFELLEDLRAQEIKLSTYTINNMSDLYKVITYGGPESVKEIISDFGPHLSIAFRSQVWSMINIMKLQKMEELPGDIFLQ